ncbi:MAG: formimidoylglutamate deiminase [Rhizobiales bacterium]|nr:formimidoylglutamate deiminase [Hyphomicrobiales bacterium]
MTELHFTKALTPDGWKRDVRVSVEAGRIASVTPALPPGEGDERHAIGVPGMGNLHSHAFQRGMAGLAEFRGAEADTFWTWRETMYRFALSMSPDDVEAVAAQLYVEMLEAGFARVGEFHYLHHDQDGRQYADIAEMVGRIAAAASETGIGLTLLPVFYAHSTFGGAPPTPGQRRFISSLDQFEHLLDETRKVAAGLDGANVGVAPHSLRAVVPDELEAVTAMAGKGPIHIHVAEQVKEVEDCQAWSGARPVEWLLGHADVDERWCLIHATHMTDNETRRLAASGATAGLCPVTEANLGDGVFNGPLFLQAGGRFGIGSDSNIRIGVADELCQLEYAQRLRDRARNVMATGGGSTGRALFGAAISGGAAALGVGPAGLVAGAVADIVSLRADHPALLGRDGDALLDSWIFAGSGDVVDCVWARGAKRVADGRHHRRDAVRARFRAAMERLVA